MKKKIKNIEKTLEEKLEEFAEKYGWASGGLVPEEQDELLEASIQHHQFYAIQAEKLVAALNEISEVGDMLSIAIAKNAVDRYGIDKNIFANKLFK